MKALPILAAAALLASGSAAVAQSSSDAQCIIVSNAFASQAKDEKAKKIAEASVYFYLGRIGSTMTSAQLKALLDAQVKTLTNENAGPTMQKCAAAIQTKVDMLQSIAGTAKPAAAAPAAKKPTPTR